jgi:hypothetical protein
MSETATGSGIFDRIVSVDVGAWSNYVNCVSNVCHQCIAASEPGSLPAVVATGSMLTVATEVTQAANDNEQLVPMIEKIQALPKELGRVRLLRNG